MISIEEKTYLVDRVNVVLHAFLTTRFPVLFNWAFSTSENVKNYECKNIRNLQWKVLEGGAKPVDRVENGFGSFYCLVI